MSTYLVLGASGTVGSRLAALLESAGHAVRATTSRRAAVGRTATRETVFLDVATGEGLTEAFAGVDGAFLLVPPGHADQYKVAAPLIAEVKRAKLGKVVLMTALGANAAETPFLRAERELAASGVPFNIVRPNWFMENFNTFWLGGIVAEGRIRLPVGGGKASFIDASDIAAVAARLLTTHDLDGRDFDLTGPEALDHAAAARIISEASGRKVVFEDIAPEAMLAGLLAHGVPADYARFLVEILGYLKAGYAERTTTAVKDLTGRDPVTFAQYAQRARRAWLAAA